MSVPSAFPDRLAARVERRKTPLCVGIDPHLEMLPSSLRGNAAARVRRFCLGILEAVAPRVAVVKPQVAFFEQLGPDGMRILAETVREARRRRLLVIADAKRGDIGSTSQGYAEAFLAKGGPFESDALTVNPYLGTDGIEPFLAVARRHGKGLFVLVKTSNRSSAELQDLEVAPGEPLWLRVGRLVERWGNGTAGASGYDAVGAVVGATHPDQAARLRRELPRTLFLVPGFGAQGAAAADLVPCFDPSGGGAIVNSSRKILFAYKEGGTPSRWLEAAEKATEDAVLEIRRALAAGRAS